MGELKKFKPYELYSDTNAVWYKQKPAHWVCERFKYNFREKKKKNATELPAGSISFGEVILKNEDNLSQDTKESYQEVLAGEFLINPLNLNFDLKSLRTALSTINVVVSTGYIVLQGCGLLHSRFARWLLQQFDVSHMKTLGAGVRQTINYADIGNSIFCRPTLKEQKVIAAFLDHETAKIDNLIEKQQQLIELLKEKRQAVISHAVTKGLNPDVPMKDSGVEWLGKVPEDWIIAQLKFNTLEMQTGPFGSQLHAEDYVVDGIPLINPAHMNAGMIIPDPKVTVDEATQERLERHKLSEGEIIFSRRGELGRCAVVKKNNEGWLCGTGSLKAKLTKKIIPDYAYTLISSEGVVSELTLESKGSTMANLNTETLGRIRLPVPPISEQEAILGYIKIISDKYDYLIRSADTAIRLMQERRTALISAAVTGKIDVRDWVAPDTRDVEVPQEATA